MSIKRTSHARYEIWYHLAWATKYRKKVFIKEETKRIVKLLLRKIVAAYEIEIGTIEVLSDHVHLTISTPPRIAPSRAVQLLKGLSTKILFEQFSWLRSFYWGGEVWAGGYFIRSIGPGLTKEDIDQYIIEQSEET